MPGFLLFFWAVPAYAGFILTLAALAAPLWSLMPADQARNSRVRACGGKTGAMSLLSGACALAAFLFLPAGSLPPFYDVSWGGAASAGCLAAGLGCGAVRSPAHKVLAVAAARTALPALVVLLAGFAWHAWQWGVPGGLFSLGTHAGMPLWDNAGPWSRAGLLCLFLAAARGSLPAYALALRTGLPGQLWYLAFSAIMVCFFLPWSFGGLAGLSGLFLFIVDFCFFWGKTLGAALWLLPGAGRITRAIPWPALWTAGGVCMAVGFGQ